MKHYVIIMHNSSYVKYCFETIDFNLYALVVCCFYAFFI